VDLPVEWKDSTVKVCVTMILVVTVTMSLGFYRNYVTTVTPSLGYYRN